MKDGLADGALRRIPRRGPAWRRRGRSVEHAKHVVACWSSGDLAGAVNALEEGADGDKAILAKAMGAAP